MRIFKNKAFNGWAKDINMSDAAIYIAAEEIAAGNYEASLGQKIYKKRVAVGNKGKSGSARTIVAFNVGNHIFFMYGFTKGKKTNITSNEKKVLQKMARLYLGYSDKELDIAIKQMKLFEVENNG